MNNTIEYKVYGRYALFTDPITKIGGEKFTYPVPTYQALKGITESIYWKPTIIWIIDECRIMNKIQTEVKAVKNWTFKNNIKEENGRDLYHYTYLKDVEYKVKAHFEWNINRIDLEKDHIYEKHHNIAKRMIEKGGRRDIFLGTRECQGYVEPTKFSGDDGEYDGCNMEFGMMYHSIIYNSEVVNSAIDGNTVINLQQVKMNNGIIKFNRPEECSVKRYCKLTRVNNKEFKEGINLSSLNTIE